MGEIAQLIESRAEHSQHGTAESKRNKQSDCQSILIARSFAGFLRKVPSRWGAKLICGNLDSSG